jgi:arylformamidase
MALAMHVIDLSYPIRPHFRWHVASERRLSHEAGDLFQSTVVSISCHAYTHVDAPVHFLPGDRDVARMPVDQWMGPAALVDLSHLGESAEVTPALLERHAAHVEPGDIVLIRTDWPRKVRVESEQFWKVAPFMGRPACEWLVARRAKAVGYDFPSDYSIRTTMFSPGTPVTKRDCTTHDVFFPAGITVVEYLTNLDRIGAARCRFIALPLKLEGADGSPVRAVALVD